MKKKAQQMPQKKALEAQKMPEKEALEAQKKTLKPQKMALEDVDSEVAANDDLFFAGDVEDIPSDGED